MVMISMWPFRVLTMTILIAASASPVGAAELAQPNGIEEGFLLWSSSAEYEAIWKGDPPRDPWLMPDAVASTYDVGSRALRSGDGERAYRLWLPLAQAGNCRAKFAIGYLLDPESPAALETVTDDGRAASVEERAAAAFAWYLSAAEEGWPAAQRRVADAYAAGRIVPPDLAAARLWYRRAARNLDPDAMAALARLLLRSDSGAARVEGLTWALIARDDKSLFWFNDTEVGALVTAYEQTLSEDEIAAAMQIAERWWPIDYAIDAGYGDKDAPHMNATRQMYLDLTPVQTSPAAVLDAGAVAYLEGRHHDAFSFWWPLARRGYCQAQFAVGSLLQWHIGDGIQPLQYPPDEPLSWGNAIDTAVAHAAMQGVVQAQILAGYLSLPGDLIILPLQEASGRWFDRAGAQGDLQSIRNPFTYRRSDGIP